MSKMWLKSLLAPVVFFAAVAAGCPQPAHSQPVDVTEALVVYFDEAATVRSWYGTGPVTAYIIAGPLYSWTGTAFVPYQQLEAWSGEISLVPQVGRATATVVPRGGAAPAVINLTEGHAFLDVTLPTPLPLHERTVVADLQLVVTSNLPTIICLEGWQYRADGATGWFAMLTNGSDGPMSRTCFLAGINTAAPVPVAQDSWGAIKAMFR
jgi:hypothetical protein